jgi:two-component system, NarL family, response regulator LiaR
MDKASITAAFRLGAVGYVLKTQAVTELLRTIEQAVQERSPLSPKVAHTMLHLFSQQSSGADAELLTQAEMRTLLLVAQGYSNKDIARHLSVSGFTVNVQVHSILTKLQLTNRTQVALYALKRGWARLDAGSIQPKPVERSISL